jgi:fructose-bisphosphate aldolase class II
MRTLREVLADVRRKGVAVAHFNISDSNQFNAIIGAARECAQPVVVGVSEGERKFIGVKNAGALVAAARADGVEVYLNADHTYSLELVQEAIDAGFDAVIYDGSHLPFEENAENAKRAVVAAKASGRDVLIEGEIGRIGTSSKLLDAKPDDIDAVLTTAEEAKRFVDATGVDLLAPAVGTMHGRMKSGPPPRIDAVRIKELKAATDAGLVLHGGSGSIDEDFAAAVRAGMSLVHINTDIRVAYRKGIEAGLAKDPNEIAPYRFLADGVAGVQAEAARYMRLFALES